MFLQVTESINICRMIIGDNSTYIKSAVCKCIDALIYLIR